jgi:cell fate regulator YaaT (PSP1 superfamily)
MEKVIGIRFKKTGKLYYLDPLEYNFAINDNVIAESERGEELGRVVRIQKREELPKNLEIGKVIRPATKADLDNFKENEIKAKEALQYCKQVVKEMQLEMKLLSAEYTIDASKIIIYFVSEERVDFRELVKNLATKFRSRIELRQIGPRDEIKEYPNLGICGKEVCCRSYLQDFDPVTIKMAKDQGLQINMSKLSGSCGKLMCCLKYEDEAYKENLKKLPKVGQIVTVEGERETGKVIGIDVLHLKVKVKFGTTREDEKFEVYPVENIKWNLQ